MTRHEATPVRTPEEAVACLARIYRAQHARVVERFQRFASGQDLDPSDADLGYYPELRVSVAAAGTALAPSLNLGRLSATRTFATTITRPELFADYLATELADILDTYPASMDVGLSDRPIPLAFAVEAAEQSLTPAQRETLALYFHQPDLVATNDDVVDGKRLLDRDDDLPLSLFPAERVDYSLHRIRHYCATDPEHFQPYIMFTNYARYVDEFLDYARAEIAAGRAHTLVEPGNRITDAKTLQAAAPRPAGKLPQMPAYHIKRHGAAGVTLVNIGVGPSNAKTITDHLAVLRPHVWLMVGHCGALRRTQRLGDYVLAHAYLREDGVLDHLLKPSIPVPALAEVQLALTRAVERVTGFKGAELKRHLRTGTVVTTDDRNWELRFREVAGDLNQARAIAIDMESATVAANGYRYRVPYGTLLCASDRPLHGELKLPGMADAFYEARVDQHLAIGLEALRELEADERAGTLHSRKLRSFDEPLLR